MFWLPVFCLPLPWLQTPLCFILTTLTCQVTSSSLYCYLGFLMEFTKPWKFPFFPFACNFPLVVKCSIFFSHLISRPPAGTLGCPLGFLSSTWVFAGADHLQRETVRQRGWRKLTHSCVSPLSFRKMWAVLGDSAVWDWRRQEGEGSRVWFRRGQLSSAAHQWTGEHSPCLSYWSEPIWFIQGKKLFACKYFDEITGFC